MYLRQKFEDDPAIHSGVIALFVFLVLAPWWPSQESNWTEIWSVSSSYLVVQIFRSIAPAVTKRAMLTDMSDPNHPILLTFKLLKFQGLQYMLFDILAPVPQIRKIKLNLMFRNPPNYRNQQT
jgi:hypothetical protein